MSWLSEVERRLTEQPVRRLPREKGLRESAVLVPLFVQKGELWVLLTLRVDSLPQHAGQYAFPGGVREDADEDEVATAVRETSEELGIDPAVILTLGHLDEIATPTGYLISPIVGALPYPLEFKPERNEVEKIVTAPMSVFISPRVVEEQTVTIDGVTHTYPVYHYLGHRIWGATARILADLVSRLTSSSAEAVG